MKPIISAAYLVAATVLVTSLSISRVLADQAQTSKATFEKAMLDTNQQRTIAIGTAVDFLGVAVGIAVPQAENQKAFLVSRSILDEWQRIIPREVTTFRQAAKEAHELGLARQNLESSVAEFEETLSKVDFKKLPAAREAEKILTRKRLERNIISAESIAAEETRLRAEDALWKKMKQEWRSGARINSTDTPALAFLRSRPNFFKIVGVGVSGFFIGDFLLRASEAVMGLKIDTFPILEGASSSVVQSMRARKIAARDEPHSPVEPTSVTSQRAAN